MSVELIVETGAGLDTATSYVTVDEANQYLENTGRKGGDWGALGTSDKSVALNVAFTYMLARWSSRWHGIAANEDQAGDWPRRGVTKRSGHYYDSDEIPEAVKRAQIEYAYVHVAQGGLFIYPEYDESNRAVTSKSEKVGPLSESKTFSDSSQPQTFRKYPVADRLLQNLVAGGSQFELQRV